MKSELSILAATVLLAGLVQLFAARGATMAAGLVMTVGGTAALWAVRDERWLIAGLVAFAVLVRWLSFRPIATGDLTGAGDDAK